MLHTFIKYLLRNQLLFILFLIASAWFLIQIRDIIVSIFLSYIIMAAVLPSVEFLKRKRVPSVLAVLIPYTAIIIAIFLLIVPLVPFTVEQIQSLLTKFPQFIDRSATTFGFQIDKTQLQQYLNNEFTALSQNAVDFTTKIFGGIFSVITIFVVSFYLLMYSDNFKKFTANLFHDGSRAYIEKTLDQINEKLGAWLRGELVLMFFIGLFSWIGLTILGMPYALPLALMAGLLEIVPTLGPILSAIPAAIVAFTISPTMAITVIVLYTLIQALENQLLVPKIMQKAVGLNPVLVILSVMIGANLMGIAGALLAIPFVSFLIVVINSFEGRK
ncbi:AI-2E family transporter [Candidatus Roizmanbacteria bacterium]|nr:AI-2E family transporter [Candidatus Roizmanbacteria bacterium]